MDKLRLAKTPNTVNSDPDHSPTNENISNGNASALVPNDTTVDQRPLITVENETTGPRRSTRPRQQVTRLAYGNNFSQLNELHE